MTQRRVTAANQLSTVIDVLQLGRKTGVLTVERGEGETFEEGTMTLVHGQVVQATTGFYRGTDAATKLFSWQACRFLFVPMPPEQIAQATLPIPHTQMDAKVVTENTNGSFYRGQQTNLAAQGDMSRRPIIAAHYKEPMNDILHMLDRQGFSRTHRRLLLLIDGRRSIRELAALIRRTPNETLALLVDLEQADLVRL